MTIESWKPGREVWRSFCEANPGLALSGSPGSYVWLTRTHGAALIQHGAALKTTGRRWLFNDKTFPAVAFTLLTGAPQ